MIKKTKYLAYKSRCIRHEQLIESNNENENQIDFEFNKKFNEDKNTKQDNFPKKILELINKIKEKPSSYANIKLDCINNFIINQR